MTEKLYYTDPGLLEFTATVQDGWAEDAGTAVVLDRTAFYPEGGGQPADRGTLGGFPVVHVRKDGDRVVHIVNAASAALESKSSLTGSVDAHHRRDFMQQHTGQHIISAALLSVGGHNTVSVHLGDEYATIEVSSAEVSSDHLRAVEEEANRTIEAAIPVTSVWVTDSEIGDYPLRRPPKVSGEIRIVRIGDTDCVACGGVHAANTRMVRLVRLIGIESIRGNTRTAWKIGDRALAHYRESSEIVARLGDLMSAQPHEIVERFKAQDQRFRSLEADLRREREARYELAAHSLVAAAADTGASHIVTAEFTDEHKEFLRGVSKELSTVTGVAACLTNRTGDQLQWSIAIGPASRVDPAGFLTELLPIIGGKGGGKPPLWQGIGLDVDGSARFFSRFKSLAGG